MVVTLMGGLVWIPVKQIWNSLISLKINRKLTGTPETENYLKYFSRTKLLIILLPPSTPAKEVSTCKINNYLGSFGLTEQGSWHSSVGPAYFCIWPSHSKLSKTWQGELIFSKHLTGISMIPCHIHYNLSAAENISEHSTWGTAHKRTFLSTAHREH